MSLSEVVVNAKILKSENVLRAHLLAALIEVVVGGPFFLLTLVFVDDFLFRVVCVALATASLYGKTISDAGVTAIMLVSVLQAAAFLSFFFGGPLK